MKRYLLSSILLLPYLLVAQITIDLSDMPQVGDLIVRANDTLTQLTPGPAGANQVWDMTVATAHYNDSTRAVSPASTSYGSTFPTANLAMTNDNVTYLFFKLDNNGMNSVGLAGDLLGTGSPISVNFSPEVIVHQFPRSYGSNFSNPNAFDVTTDGSAFGVSQVRLKRTAMAWDSTDAWGQITTPEGTYDVLRVKRVEYIMDSVFAMLLPPPIGQFQLFDVLYDTTYNYAWYAKGMKLAVAELNLDMMQEPTSFTWYVPSTSGITQTLDAKLFQIYPNPVNEEIFVQLNDAQAAGNYTFTVLNIEGKEVFTAACELSPSPTRFDLGALAAGSYVWKLNRKDTKQQLSGKLVKK